MMAEHTCQFQNLIIQQAWQNTLKDRRDEGAKCWGNLARTDVVLEGVKPLFQNVVCACQLQQF